MIFSIGTGLAIKITIMKTLIPALTLYILLIGPGVPFALLAFSWLLTRINGDNERPALLST